MYSSHQRAHEDEGFNPFQSQGAHLPNSRPSGMIEANRVPSRFPDAAPPRPAGPPPPQPSQPIYGAIGSYEIDPLDPTPYTGYPTEPQDPIQQHQYLNTPQHDASPYASSQSPMRNPPTQPMYNTGRSEQPRIHPSQMQPQQQPAHAPFVTTNNHAPARTAPYQTTHGVPRVGWFMNENHARTQQQVAYIPGLSQQNHAPYQFHVRDASVSSSSSATDTTNLDSPMVPSPAYGSPAEIDQPHSYALQQYAPPSQPPPNTSTSNPIVRAAPSEAGEQSPTDDGTAITLNTVLPSANTMFVDGIPVPPHQQYYPRSAWGPPPPRKVVQARMEEQRRLQQAHISAVRSGGSSDVSLSSTVNPAALGGGGSKRKQPPESDALADNGNVEMTNPTSGDLDNLVDGYNDNEKPPYPLSTILKFALLGSPRGKLTLAEIYETLMARFPFFKHVKTDWQNSVRHTLSLHVCFVRVARAITDPGKGSYWTYEPSRGDGINRKRKSKKKKSTVAQDSDQAREYIEVRDSSPDDPRLDEDPTARLPEASTSSAVSPAMYHQGPLGRPNQSSAQSPYTVSASANASVDATTRDATPIHPRAAANGTQQRASNDEHEMDVDQELVFMAWGLSDSSSASSIPGSTLTSASVHLNSAPSRGALDQLEYSSSSGSATDRAEGGADNGPAARDSENQSPPVARPPPSSRRRHMTQQEEREAEELRQRDLGELVELRQARKRKEREKRDRGKAPQQQEPAIHGSSGRAELSRSDDESSGPSSVIGVVSAKRRTSSRARTTQGESNKSSSTTSLYSVASTNKYLPVQRAPPPEHLQQLQHVHQNWNGRLVMGVPVSMPPPITSHLPVSNSPYGSISPVPDTPTPHAYSAISPQLPPVRPSQSTPSRTPPTATLTGLEEPNSATASRSATSFVAPNTQAQQSPFSHSPNDRIDVTMDPSGPTARIVGTAPLSHDSQHAPHPYPRPRPQSQAHTQALSQSLSSQSLRQTQQNSPSEARVGELAISTMQTAPLTQGPYAQHAYSTNSTQDTLQTQRRTEDSEPLLNDTAANRAYIAQLDPSKIKRGPSGRARIPIDPQAIARIKAQKAAQQQHSAQDQGEGTSGG